MNHALDTAQTMNALQAYLEGDAAMPVHGLGPEAFAECLLALRRDGHAAHTGDARYSDSESDEEDSFSPGSRSPVASGVAPAAHRPATSQRVAFGVGETSGAPAAASVPASAAPPRSASSRPSAGVANASLQAPLLPDGDQEYDGGPAAATIARDAPSDDASGLSGARLGSRERLPVQRTHLVDADGTHVSIGVPRVDSGLYRTSASARLSRTLRRMFRTQRFARAIDALVLTNICVLLVEVELISKFGLGTWDTLTDVEVSAPFFDLAFLAEISLKLWAFGLRPFFRMRSEAYALIVIGITICADFMHFLAPAPGAAATAAAAAAAAAATDPDFAIAAPVIGDANGDGWGLLGNSSAAPPDDSLTVVTLRVALALRLLRIPRLVFSLSEFTAVFGHLLSRLRTYFGLMGFIFVVFTLFAQLGVALFGGLIKTTTPYPKGAELFFWCNFNDYPSAMLTLFELWFVNNWFVIMEGAVRSGGGNWARAYCVTWWVVASIFIMNILVAQLLETSDSALEGGVKEGDDANHSLSATGRPSRTRATGASAQGFNRRHNAAMTEQMATLAQRGPAATLRRARAVDADESIDAPPFCNATTLDQNAVDHLRASMPPVGAPDAASSVERGAAEGWTGAPDRQLHRQPASNEAL